MTAKLKDLSGDNRLPEACAAYLAAQEVAEKAKRDLKALKAEIVGKLGKAAAARCAGFVITRELTKASPAKVITKDMVGQTIGGRAASEKLAITATGAESRDG